MFRRLPAASVLIALAMSVPAACGAQAYSSATAFGNMLGLGLTNYGFIGNNWISRDPSLWYRPDAVDHYEHLPRAGLWIGANAVDVNGAFTGVTTACLDGSVGSSITDASEFTPASPWTFRSSLVTSPYYSPDAVSDFDLVANFDDRTPRHAINNPESHRPLGVTVRLECYQWRAAPLSDVAFLRYIVKSDAPLTGVWFGLYTEFVAVDQSLSVVWPPSGAYHKSWLQYDADWRLLRHHYCASQPVPAGCQLATVPYWTGVAVLTPPDAAGGQHVTTAGWLWSPSSPLRDTDAERYAIMSAGTLQDWTQPDLMPVTGDPSELVAVGPFAALVPGDSVVVDFAFLGGAEIADIQRQAYDAQRARDLDFRDIATPALASLAASDAASDRVALAWYAPGAGDATLERHAAAGAWTPLAALHADGDGMVRYVDRDVVPGARYGYRLAAAGVTSAEAWVDVPARPALAIVAPRIDAAAVHTELTLADAAPAELRLMDVAGRTLARRAVGGVAGRVTAELPAPRASGVYWLRLAQGGRVVSARLVSVR